MSLFKNSIQKNHLAVILHFVTWYPTKENHVEGIFIQRHIELLASNKDYRHIVIRKNVKPVSVLQHLKYMLGFFERETIGSMSIISLPEQSELYKKYFWRYKEAIEHTVLNRLVKCYQPAFVHLHVVYGFAKEALFLKEMKGLPFIVSEHMAAFPFEWIQDKQGFITEPMQEASAVVAVSSAQAQQINAFTGINSTVIPNVVNSEEYFYREREKIGEGLQIVLAGIYDSRKGADYLLSVLPFFLLSHPNTKLHLVGEASAERMAVLQGQIKKTGIENAIRFYGRLSATDLCKLFHQCDFYVCSSNWESFGVSVLEALFSGLPVLSTNCGGVLEFMNEENGLLISNDRKEETLLNGLLQMTNQLSAFNRQEISKSVIERFSRSMIKDKYYSLYKQVLETADMKSRV